MLFKMLKKEIIQFSRDFPNLVFMFVAPILLIFIMSSIFSNVIGNTNSIKEVGKVLYIVEDKKENFETFKAFQEIINSSYTEINFIEVYDYNQGVERVNEQEAYAVITIDQNGFEYYRSPYNEQLEGSIFRSIFSNLITNLDSLSDNEIIIKNVELNRVDSKSYYTFAILGFVMLYISMIIANSIYRERKLKTIHRIYLSCAKVQKMVISKVLLGVLIGFIQIVIVHLYSSIFLNVSWGTYTLLIYLLFLSLALFSALLGAFIGIRFKSQETVTNGVLVLSILIGILGGGLTPLKTLEAFTLLATICKISPLYWITKSSISLSTGYLQQNFFIGILSSVGLSILIFIAINVFAHKTEKKGELIYA